MSTTELLPGSQVVAEALKYATPGFEYDPNGPTAHFVEPFHRVLAVKVGDAPVLSTAENIYYAHNEASQALLDYVPDSYKERERVVENYQNETRSERVVEIDTRDPKAMLYPYASMIKPFVMFELGLALTRRGKGIDEELFSDKNGKYTYQDLVQLAVRESQGEDASNSAFVLARNYLAKYYGEGDTTEQMYSGMFTSEERLRKFLPSLQMYSGMLTLEEHLRTFLPSFTLRKPFIIEGEQIQYQSTFEMDKPNLGSMVDLVEGFGSLIKVLLEYEEGDEYGSVDFAVELLDALRNNDSFSSSSAASLFPDGSQQSEIEIYNIHGLIPLDTCDIPQLSAQEFPPLSGIGDVFVIRYNGTLRVVGYLELIEMGTPQRLDDDGVPSADLDPYFQYAAFIRRQYHMQGFSQRLKDAVQANTIISGEFAHLL